jgi:hypothetical protein
MRDASGMRLLAESVFKLLGSGEESSIILA